MKHGCGGRLAMLIQRAVSVLNNADPASQSSHTRRIRFSPTLGQYASVRLSRPNQRKIAILFSPAPGAALTHNRTVTVMTCARSLPYTSTMSSLFFLFLKQLENCIDSPVNPRHLLEYVSTREDNQRYQQNGNRNQQGKPLAKEGREDGDANSDDEQEPQSEEILRVRPARVSQPSLMLLLPLEQGFHIWVRLAALIHRLVVEHPRSETPRHGRSALSRDDLAGFGASDWFGHAMPFLTAGRDAANGRDSTEPEPRRWCPQKEISTSVTQRGRHRKRPLLCRGGVHKPSVCFPLYPERQFAAIADTSNR